MSRVAALLFLAVSGGAVQAADPPGDELTVRHAYVDAYLRSAPKTLPDPQAERLDEAPLPPALEGLDVAAPWLRLMGAGQGDGQWEAARCRPEGTPAVGSRLCGLRWRKGGAYAELSNRLDEFSTRFKARMVGKELADNLELDVDSSPEIRFRWEFD